MTRYTIYTENKNREELENLLAQYLSSFTILAGKGVYRGQAEPCLVITYIGADGVKGLFESIARDIKQVNEQDSVLVTIEPLTFFEA